MSKQEWDSLGKETKNSMKIKFAQFEREGIDPLENPARETFEAEEDYKKWQKSPPYRLPDVAHEIGKIATVLDTKLSEGGMELTVEFKDGKLYTIKLSPARG